MSGESIVCDTKSLFKLNSDGEGIIYHTRAIYRMQTACKTMKHLSKHDQDPGHRVTGNCTHIRWLLKNRCERKEKYLLFDVWKAFDRN